ncbi:hypothetical protein [Iningainema tapete]|uniref:Uncharacterized protein n=1 Tax=Iningainema tapete BLCC-T55 TaxID=2748662 RepID=A0A8J6XL35_9CYAN|nr:hypothetical protein [Iningainema tapete]MBD2775017.1 hypothetical protein [Iningainema tapete BLCC-T55]
MLDLIACIYVRNLNIYDVFLVPMRSPFFLVPMLSMGMQFGGLLPPDNQVAEPLGNAFPDRTWERVARVGECGELIFLHPTKHGA